MIAAWLTSVPDRLPTTEYVAELFAPRCQASNWKTAWALTKTGTRKDWLVIVPELRAINSICCPVGAPSDPNGGEPKNPSRQSSMPTSGSSSDQDGTESGSSKR